MFGRVVLAEMIRRRANVGLVAFPTNMSRDSVRAGNGNGDTGSGADSRESCCLKICRSTV